MLLLSLVFTLDGKLLSEARPRPQQIADPLATEAIPGALAVLRYFASIDAVSLEQLLGASSDAAEQALGFPAPGTIEERRRCLVGLVHGLKMFGPAMVHAEAAARAQVVPGRPNSDREETLHAIVELRATWLEHGDGDDDAFLDFALLVFSIAGSTSSISRELVKDAIAASGLAVDADAAAIDEAREGARRRRAEIASFIHELSPVRFNVNSFAEGGLNAARALGWTRTGTEVAWREKARRTRTRRRAGKKRAHRRETKT